MGQRVPVGQPSLFSAQARAPRIDDLAGLLCAQGQPLGFGRGAAARVSVVVAESWRADEVARALTVRGLVPELTSSDEGHPVVRTAFVADLAPLAARWTRGAVKACPDGLQLDGAVLRLWTVVAGSSDGSGYVLGLDAHAPRTHLPLAVALASAGLAATLLGPRSGGPALRVTGRRRTVRLAELVGDAPTAAPSGSWPG